MIQSSMRSSFKFVALTSIICSAAVFVSPSLCEAQTSHITSMNLPNFAPVDPGLYRGAAPTATGIGQLKSMGIHTIIDLRISPKLVAAESARVRSLGMNFVNIPLGAEPATPDQQRQFLTLIHQASPQNQVFVHCQHGADRTGEMIGLHRRVDDHWSYAKTYAEMRSFGFKTYYPKLAAVVEKAAPNAK